MSVTVRITEHRTKEPGRWWFVHGPVVDGKGAMWELVSCPTCGEPMPVDNPGGNHKGDWQKENGDFGGILVSPSMICPKCGFHDSVVLGDAKPE